MPNIIVGVLEGIWVDAIHGYAQSKDLYFIFDFIGPSIFYMLHGYLIHGDSHKSRLTLVQGMPSLQHANSLEQKSL